MARPLRPEAPGRVFHLTARSTWGRELFLTDADREDFLRLLERVVRRYRWQCLAWCLMDTHYHLIVRTPAANLGAGMRDLNGAYARRFNERHGRFGSVLAERYAHRVVRSEEHFANALRYVALNPVFAGLVRRADHWRWSSHRALAGLIRRPFALAVRAALRLFRGTRDDYRRFVDSGARDTAASASASASASKSASGSGASQTTASGGSVTSAENGCSFHGVDSASTPKPLPTSEPP
jgi:putative transposase